MSDPITSEDRWASRASRLMSHLDGVLDESTLDAMQTMWSSLEFAATSEEAHARAVRARLFWQYLQPGGVGDYTVSDDEQIVELFPGGSSLDADEPLAA